MNNKFSKLNIKEFFKGFLDRDPEKIEPSPRKDWFLLVLFFFVLSVVFVIFYYFMFSSQKDFVATLDTQNGTPTEIISKTKLESTLTPWKLKEERFNEYFNNRPDFDFLK